ncbi:MAG: Rpn family recombination-promoting nuclease/putative transposase [Tumebacillaceae bacterium]
MKQLMDLKIDFAFKQIFGTQGNEPILIAFLNAALRLRDEQRIMAVEILNSEITREHPDDKASFLDIYAKTERGVHINIEIQLANQNDMDKRTLFYWARIFAGQLGKGNEYDMLSKTITINILNFRFHQETERFHTTFHLYEDEEGFPLTDCLEVHFIELPKLMKMWEYHEVDTKDELVRWLLLLEAYDHEDIRMILEEIAMEDPAMKQAFEQWDEVSQDQSKWYAYLSRLKYTLDQNSLNGRMRRIEMRMEQVEKEKEQAKKEKEQAEKEKEQAQTEIAKKLMAMGIELEKIAEATGISLEVLKEWK